MGAAFLFSVTREAEADPSFRDFPSLLQGHKCLPSIRRSTEKNTAGANAAQQRVSDVPLGRVFCERRRISVGRVRLFPTCGLEGGQTSASLPR
jgi:hypothetical protein